MRIRGSLYGWIESFLLDRKQMVNIEVSKSQEFVVVSGMTQGQVLDSNLFNIHISDIDEQVQLDTVRFFADDTRLTKKMETKRTAEEYKKILKRLCIEQKEIT